MDWRGGERKKKRCPLVLINIQLEIAVFLFCFVYSSQPERSLVMKKKTPFIRVGNMRNEKGKIIQRIHQAYLGRLLLKKNDKVCRGNMEMG